MRATHNAGALIREARLRLGWSQVELAEKLAVSQPAIAHWESGVHAPRSALLPRIAELLGIPRDELSGRRSAAKKPRYVALMSLPKWVSAKWVSEYAAVGATMSNSISYVGLSKEAAPVLIKVDGGVKDALRPMDLAGRAPQGHGNLWYVETPGRARRP